VTLSKWELDKVFPTVACHRGIIDYLGYDPFGIPQVQPSE